MDAKQENVPFKKCSIDWCNRKVKPHGKYCAAHYQERMKYGKFFTLEERAENKRKAAEDRKETMKRVWDNYTPEQREERASILRRDVRCSIEGCGRKHSGHGLCDMHLYRLKHFGAATGVGPTRPNRGKGRTIAPTGYVQLFVPDYHCASKKGYVFEHRYVMEQHLGRHLKKGEVVHHIDGDKQNNAIENLQLFASHSEHLSVGHFGKEEHHV